MEKGNTPHQRFVNNLRKQVKREETHSKKTSSYCDFPKDDDTEEDLQRLLELKFDELFGVSDDDE